MTLDKQIDELRSHWKNLVANLLPRIRDGLQLTIEFTPVDRYDGCCQTYWVSVRLTRDSDPEAVAEDIASRLIDQVY